MFPDVRYRPRSLAVVGASPASFVGRIALKDGRGTMAEWRYVDGATVLPGDEEVRRLRPDTV